MRVPCVGAIIGDGAGHIVLIRRGHPPAQGSWSIPGGRVHAHEPLPDAVRREVAEETGLQVQVGRVAGQVDLPGPQGAVYVVTDFVCTPVGGTALTPGDDADDARWVSRHELSALPLSPGLADTLERWKVWDSPPDGGD